MTINIKISVSRQQLELYDDAELLCSYTIATAKNGVGEIKGSEKTPRGRHKIRAKIGQGAAADTVFVGRRPTGEIFAPGMREQFPRRDWILTRIMWLSGLEPSFNRLGQVDTMRRYIYIHGCPDEDKMGIPSSHGCIKMRNSEIIELFDRVPVGACVLIEE